MNRLVVLPPNHLPPWPGAPDEPSRSALTATMDDSWTVVGASGRPRKGHGGGGKQQQPSGSASQQGGQARGPQPQQEPQPALPGWGVSFDGEGSSTHSSRPAGRPKQAKHSAAAQSNHTQNGNSDPQGSHSSQDEAPALQAHLNEQQQHEQDQQARARAEQSWQQGRGRRGRHAKERTPEEIAAWLEEQVLDCMAQVRRSKMYASLRAAMAQAEPHLPMQAWAAASSAPRQQGPGQAAESATATQAQGQAEAGQGSGGATDAGAERSGGGESSSSPWAAVQHMVVYGLGSPQESRTSRYQLALALLLQRELLPGLAAPPAAYDPAFTPVDRLLLGGRMGWELVEQDERCARVARQPTLFYLPHLEGHLCDNLLTANLQQPGQQQQPEPQQQPEQQAAQLPPLPPSQPASDSDMLPNCLVLANRFSTYRDRWELRGTGSTGSAAGAGSTGRGGATNGGQQQVGLGPRRPDTMLALMASGRVLELDIREGSDLQDVPSAFNDMALHALLPAPA